MNFDTLLKSHLGFDYLRKGLFHKSDDGMISHGPLYNFINNLVKLSDTEDTKEDGIDIFNKKLMKDLNDDINRHIMDGNLVLQDIPDYKSALVRLELVEDCPEEGIFIEGMPNINGCIVSLMLTCAISRSTSGLEEELCNEILCMFQKSTISEVYSCYIRLFTPFINTIAGNQEKTYEVIDNIGDKLKDMASLIEYYKKKQSIMYSMDRFTEIFIKEYDINNTGFNTRCPITLEDFSDRERILRLPCGHAIKLGCVHRINSSISRCPICRDEPLENRAFWEQMSNIGNLLKEFENSDKMRNIEDILNLTLNVSEEYKKINRNK